MSRKRNNDLLELEIHDLAFGGKGISWLENEHGKIPVFVPNTIPGQRVLARTIKKKKQFIETKIISILEKSKLEKEIPFQEIPGAPYAGLPIDLQHEYKIKNTLEVYKRIGKITDIENKFLGLIGSPQNWNYRNKMEYAFSNKIAIPNTDESEFAFGLGFKKRGQWALVENLDKESGLFDSFFENQLKNIRLYLKNTGLPAWNPAKCEGFFRIFTVRKSFNTDKILMNLVTSSQGIEQFNVEVFGQFVAETLKEKFGGLLHTINDGLGERNLEANSAPKLILGEPILQEKLLDLDFQISIESFFQPNPQCAALLYKKAIEFATETDAGNTIMDLFCGTGTIAQLVAKQAKNAQVIGVDIVAEAIEDAIKNAERNKIENVQFFAADVGDFLKIHPEYQHKIDTIILDPPRAGIMPKSLKRVIELGAKNLIYVSCNPATQARDAVILAENGYKLEKLNLVDQFPHTAHIESVAKFIKIN
jgi:23S rRNA (uracil1939-C5)-methyltransferase